MKPDAEQARLELSSLGPAAWKKWGPCVSERRWDTVREDDPHWLELLLTPAAESAVFKAMLARPAQR